MRVSRMWNDLTLRKRAGFAHDKGLATNPPPGALAFFCPACPQPGINLPPNWQNEPDAHWKYAKVITMDGNFKADHIKMNTPDDINLMNGLGYFVENTLYKTYIKTSTNIFEVKATHMKPLILSNHSLCGLGISMQ